MHGATWIETAYPKLRRAIRDSTALLLGCLLWALPAGAAGETFACAEGIAEVTAAKASEAARACAAAARTIRFMAEHGMLARGPLTIRIVPRLSGRVQAMTLGEFDARTSRIRILDYRDCRHLEGDNAPFGMPMSPELHDSFIVHEVAHAIAQDNFFPDHPSIEAHEYIAYSIQLATMDEILRERVLERYPIEAFADEREISAVYLELNPAAFAVKSYRHLQGQADPDVFYRRLLSGDFQPSDDWE